ncbi:MAG: hypothetical protein HYV09_13700 [Deltaproteobacteria bacterium]|nr:hypothetical protein [Deltaproteobacteria bacterium]
MAATGPGPWYCQVTRARDEIERDLETARRPRPGARVVEERDAMVGQPARVVLVAEDRSDRVDGAQLPRPVLVRADAAELPEDRRWRATRGAAGVGR